MTYLKSPSVDLTPRLKPFVKPDGIDMPDAELPVGDHVIRVDVKIRKAARRAPASPSKSCPERMPGDCPFCAQPNVPHALACSSCSQNGPGGTQLPMYAAVP